MNVYVESNFVLQYALEQEEADACTEIVRLASLDRIRLLIPAFSLAEPHQALSAKAKSGARLRDDLQRHLSELSRSRPYREIPETFGALAAALTAGAQFAREGLRHAIADLLGAAEVISLDARVLRSAAQAEFDYDLSGQDSIVLASVLAHLEATTPAQSCFLNRNTKDFDDPAIREKLDDFDCRFFGKFAPALAYIKSLLER